MWLFRYVLIGKWEVKDVQIKKIDVPSLEFAVYRFKQLLSEKDRDNVQIISVHFNQS